SPIVYSASRTLCNSGEVCLRTPASAPSETKGPRHMSSLTSGIGAYSFDVWKTLLNGNRSFTEPRLRLLFDILGHPEIPVDALKRAYLQADKFYNDEAERQMLDFGLA